MKETGKHHRVRDVVTVVVYSQVMNKILILKRSDKVSTYQGRWACVSGSIELWDRNAEERAFAELNEELGLGTEDINMLVPGGMIVVHDRENEREWRVHVFLAVLREGAENAIRIDWEHTQYQWVDKRAVEGYDTVPGLVRTIDLALGAMKASPSVHKL